MIYTCNAGGKNIAHLQKLETRSGSLSYNRKFYSLFSNIPSSNLLTSNFTLEIPISINWA